MNRREFIKLMSVVGVGAMLPFPFKAFASSHSALPVPGLLKPDTNGIIRLTIQKGQSSWRKRQTVTWGYNGAILGPALSVQRGQKVSFAIENALDEDTAVHWHGLEIPGVVDGGPQSLVSPGKLWKPELTIDQPAATCWFHPHPHAKTGRHVAMGLAGLLLINDEESQRLPLPKNWGVDDIPVILQDKRLNSNDQIEYSVDIVSAAIGWFGDMMLTNGVIYPRHTAPKGWLRLRLLNGCNARSLRVAASDNRPMYVIAGDGGFLPEPVKMTELQILMAERFEVLIDVRDGKPFDLMSLPVQQMGMTLPPFDNPLPVLRINPSVDKGHTVMPDKLVPLAPLPSLAGLPTRTLKLSMDPRLDREGMQELVKRYGEKAMAGMSMDGHDMGGAKDQSGAMDHGSMHMSPNGTAMPSHGSGGMGGMAEGSGMDHGGMHMGAETSGPLDIWHANFVNGQAFTMHTPAFDVKKGQYERWIISGKGDMMLHPFHIHGAQFRILSENGADPQEHRKGFKDMVHVEGKDSEVLVKFSHTAPEEHMFMAHCHVLEHEDTGMMLAFTVSE